MDFQIPCFPCAVATLFHFEDLIGFEKSEKY